MSGKGDNPRPLSVTPEQFAERFDAIDWNAREREAARCNLCGASGLHACAGRIPDPAGLQPTLSAMALSGDFTLQGFLDHFGHEDTP